MEVDKKCYRCHTSLKNKHSYYSDPDDHRVYCKTCYNYLFVRCYACEELFLRTELTYSVLDEKYFCVNCYDKNFTSCDLCNSEIRIGNTYSDGNGNKVCYDCYNGKNDIPNHTYVPHLKFYGSGSLFFGIELEVENKGDAENVTIVQKLKKQYPFIWTKQDGSLSHGFEIVSHPMSWDYIRSHTTEIIKMLIFLKNNGFQSYNTSSCGLHVHMSKKAIGNFQLYKMLKFFYENKAFILKLSQRVPHNLDEWAPVGHQTKRARQSIAKVKQDTFGGRFTAVNCLNDATIEVRIFRGTLKPSSFFKNIEFCHALYMFTLNGKLKNVRPANFKSFVNDNKKEYRNLDRFLNSNQLVIQGEEGF